MITEPSRCPTGLTNPAFERCEETDFGSSGPMAALDQLFELYQYAIGAERCLQPLPPHFQFHGHPICIGQP